MPFIFKHNSIDLPHQEQAAQTVTAGSTVSLWGKFDDVFSHCYLQNTTKKKFLVQVRSTLEVVLWGAGVTHWVEVLGVPLPGRQANQSLLWGYVHRG